MFSLPTGTEMFHFPAFPPAHLCIQIRVTRHHSCRVSPFGHPRINARLTAPRGITQPPTSFIGSQCQGIHHAPLNTYNTKQLKILGRIKNCIINTHNNTHPPQERSRHSRMRDARNHYPQIKHHTPPPKQGNNNQTSSQEADPKPQESDLPPVSHNRDEEIAGLLSQSPIVCLAIPSPQNPARRPNPVAAQRLLCTRPPPTTGERAIHRIASGHRIPHNVGGPSLVVLLRKEVIQPHLPVRLPCYDFVPIADPTFDGSLPQGVRPPASGVTDFHDVTGGVYKARERIHRSVADLRLLATPTSRGRVADPDPN